MVKWTPLTPVLWPMVLALSSACLNASTVLMSGFGAPALTATPAREWKTGTMLPGTILPALVRSPSTCGIEQHEIGRRAFLELVDRDHGAEHGHVDLVAARLLERRDQVAQDVFDRAGGHQVDVGGFDAGAGGECREAGGHDDRAYRP